MFLPWSLFLSSLQRYRPALKKSRTPPQKTKVEAFERQIGSVIIRGFSELGAIPGVFGGQVGVETREFVNATTGKKEYGVVIEVNEGGRLERKDRAYVDYDEIEALLKGIDYIVKIDRTVTTFDNFQADYTTKGEMTLSTFSSGGTVKGAVSTSRIGGADLIIELTGLQQLRNLIFEAKAKIDASRGAA
jgi:hypothetical protein